MSRTYRDHRRSYLHHSVEDQYKWLEGIYLCFRTINQPSEEEIWEEAKLDYRRSTMDGRWSETGRKTAFKRKCARHLRRQNKIFCQKSGYDEDYYDEHSAPRRRDTSTFAWDFF